MSSTSAAHSPPLAIWGRPFQNRKESLGRRLAVAPGMHQSMQSAPEAPQSETKLEKMSPKTTPTDPKNVFWGAFGHLVDLLRALGSTFCALGILFALSPFPISHGKVTQFPCHVSLRRAPTQTVNIKQYFSHAVYLYRGRRISNKTHKSTRAINSIAFGVVLPRTRHVRTSLVVLQMRGVQW